MRINFENGWKNSKHSAWHMASCQWIIIGIIIITNLQCFWNSLLRRKLRKLRLPLLGEVLDSQKRLGKKPHKSPGRSLSKFVVAACGRVFLAVGILCPLYLAKSYWKSLLSTEVMARMGRGLQKFLASQKEPPLHTPVFSFYITLDLHKSCKNSTKNFWISSHRFHNIHAHTHFFSELFKRKLQAWCFFTLKYFSVFSLKIKNFLT